MASVENGKTVGGVTELERGAIEFSGKSRTRVKRIEHNQGVKRLLESIDGRTHALTELGKNAVDFAKLLSLELTNSIPCFDSRRRLDEQCCASRRSVMHDAADHRASFATHRNHESSIANRDGHVGNAVVRFQI